MGALCRRCLYFKTAPDVPADKISLLRSAFDAMFSYAFFLNEIEKRKLEF